MGEHFLKESSTSIASLLFLIFLTAFTQRYLLVDSEIIFNAKLKVACTSSLYIQFSGSTNMWTLLSPSSCSLGISATQNSWRKYYFNSKVYGKQQL